MVELGLLLYVARRVVVVQYQATTIVHFWLIDLKRDSALKSVFGLTAVALPEYVECAILRNDIASAG